MASIERTAYPRFSKQLSDQELDARFGPTIEETALVLRHSCCDEERLTCLVMFKSRQELGYFPLLDEVPEQLLSFLRTALNLPASTALVDGRTRSHTVSRQRNLIRTQPGFVVTVRAVKPSSPP